MNQCTALFVYSHVIVNHHSCPLEQGVRRRGGAWRCAEAAGSAAVGGPSRCDNTVPGLRSPARGPTAGAPQRRMHFSSTFTTALVVSGSSAPGRAGSAPRRPGRPGPSKVRGRRPRPSHDPVGRRPGGQEFSRLLTKLRNCLGTPVVVRWFGQNPGEFSEGSQGHGGVAMASRGLAAPRG